MSALSARLEVAEGNIVRLAVDAIVNAANSSLLGGGGVDGAIHRAAGPELAVECRMLHGCATGDAKITRGYRLPASHVIHTVGPVWTSGIGDARNEALLASCYRRSLELAEQHELRSVAFPAISTGIYRFPADRAARIACTTVVEWLATHGLPENVILVAFDQRSREVLEQARGQALALLRADAHAVD